MVDHLITAMAYGGHLRALACVSTHLVEEARQRHGTWPTASAALGRGLTGGLLMGALLKGDEKVVLQFMGDGPLGQMVIVAEAMGTVRGYVTHPETHLPITSKGKLDVGGAVGQGTLYVIRDHGLKEPYRGSVPLVSGEVAEDLTHYFAASEQTPSVVALGVLVETDETVRAAGGYLVQVMPGAPERVISELEERLRGIPPVSQWVDQGKDAQEILEALLGSDLQVLGQRDVAFACSCSEERLESVLISLGAEELDAMIDEDDQAEVVCQFCNSAYHFSKEKLLRLRDKV